MVQEAFQRALNSPISLTPEMTQLLYFVTYGGYKLFPATGSKTRDDLPGPEADRHL